MVYFGIIEGEIQRVDTSTLSDAPATAAVIIYGN